MRSVRCKDQAPIGECRITCAAIHYTDVSDGRCPIQRHGRSSRSGTRRGTGLRCPSSQASVVVLVGIMGVVGRLRRLGWRFRRFWRWGRGAVGLLHGRGGGRMRVVAVLIVRLFDVGSMMSRLDTCRPVVVVPETRRNAHRGSQPDHTHCTEKDHRTRQGRHRLAAQAAVPHPASTHHHVDLQQESTQVCGLDDFGLSGVRAERGTRGPRQRPHRDGSGVEQDPCGQNSGRHADEHRPRPQQLEACERDEEHARRYPLVPMGRHHGEVNGCGPQRGERGEASCQSTVGSCLGSWCHSSDDDSTALQGSCVTSHLNRTEIVPSPAPCRDISALSRPFRRVKILSPVPPGAQAQSAPILGKARSQPCYLPGPDRILFSRIDMSKRLSDRNPGITAPVLPPRPQRPVTLSRHHIPRSASRRCGPRQGRCR